MVAKVSLNLTSLALLGVSVDLKVTRALLLVPLEGFFLMVPPSGESQLKCSKDYLYGV